MGFKPKDPKTQLKEDFWKLVGSVKTWWSGEVRNETPYEIAERRMNRVLMARFHRVDNHDDQFAVANYHNPCLFGSEEKVKALSLHSSWLVQSFQEFAGENCPRILCGDMNFTPTNSKIYEYVTTGSDELVGSLGLLDNRPDRYWQFEPDFIPLDSAYALADREDGITVYASGRGDTDPDFMGCLDYIFLSKSHWEVDDVLPIPNEEEATERGVMPNRFEPSDHLMLSATLTCRRFGDYVRTW